MKGKASADVSDESQQDGFNSSGNSDPWNQALDSSNVSTDNDFTSNWVICQSCTERFAYLQLFSSKLGTTLKQYSEESNDMPKQTLTQHQILSC